MKRTSSKSPVKHEISELSSPVIFEERKEKSSSSSEVPKKVEELENFEFSNSSIAPE